MNSPVTNQSQSALAAKFNAPLFQSLIDDLSTDERRVVLDLGAARQQTVELFSQYRCRLDIVDLAHDLDGLNALPELQAKKHAVEALLPKFNGEAADIVLSWDLMNYLDLESLSAVMSCIADRGKRGTLVHALIFYSHPQMPQRPGHFELTQDFSLVDVAQPSGQRAAPRYSPDDLKRSLVNFSIERVMLLRNGMQEFLFRL